MRTYSYGAKAPVENEKIVYQQLILAHRYYNTLVEIERQRKTVRDVVYDARRKLCPQGEKVVFTDEDENQIANADEVAWEAIRQARGKCDVYWGTYLCIEEAAQAAARSVFKTRSQMSFRHWGGPGLLAVQIQKGMTPVDLLKGEDNRVRLIGTGKHRKLYLRIGSDGRVPVWGVFPIFYHRDLPPQSVIKWVRVTTHQVGTHVKYAAQFILDGEGSKRPVPTKETIAVDLGWRKFQDDGFRVAKWRDNAGDTGELRFSEQLLQRWQKTEDLHSIRAKNFNLAIKQLLAADRQTWPFWLFEATAHAGRWESQSRLAGLVIRWRTNRFDGDTPIYDAMEAWRKQDKHLYEWESNQRLNVLRSRRENYRLFACFLAGYKQVVFEDLDLRDFAEHPDKDEPPETFITKGARPRRFKACLSELRACAKDAVGRAGGQWIELPAAYTTQRCAVCSVVRPFDAARNLMRTCECGATWDQDDNACSNLLRAAKSWNEADTRSQVQADTILVKTMAEVRRAKGLATRRAKRSKQKV